MGTNTGLGEMELLVLLAVLRLGSDAYGVSIAHEIETKRRRTVALGSVYAALERLESRGWVRSELGEATPERGGRAKRYFRITAAGVQEARVVRETLEGLWHGIPELQGGAA